MANEDYREKNAREGKAIYVPGKTPEQIAEAELSSRKVALTNKEWSVIDTAIPDIIEMLYDFENLCTHLAYEDDLDALWVNSTVRLCARAVRSVEARELAVLQKLDYAIRHAEREDK